MCIQICIHMWCTHVCVRVCVTEVTDYDERAYVAASLRARERESGRVVGVWVVCVCVCWGRQRECAVETVSWLSSCASSHAKYICMYVCMHVHRFIQTYEHENRTKYSKYISVWKWLNISYNRPAICANAHLIFFLISTWITSILRFLKPIYIRRSMLIHIYIKTHILTYIIYKLCTIKTRFLIVSNKFFPSSPWILFLCY